jgi:hypothetical protein
VYSAQRDIALGFLASANHQRMFLIFPMMQKNQPSLVSDAANPNDGNN